MSVSMTFHATCYGTNNGKLIKYISGGSPNYLYSIGNGFSQKEPLQICLDRHLFMQDSLGCNNLIF